MKRASDNLVRAAQKAAFNKADDDNVVVKTRFVGGIAQVRFTGSILNCIMMIIIVCVLRLYSPILALFS